MKLDEGAGIGSWDIRAARHAATAVLRRRPEAYHAKLRAHDERAAQSTAAAASPTAPADDTPASIHELLVAKESNLSSLLRYDAYERRSGLVRFLKPDVTRGAVASGDAQELGDFVDGAFELISIGPRSLATARDGGVVVDGSSAGVRVEKRLTLGGERLTPELRLHVSAENRSRRTLDARFAIEFALTMDGGGGNPSAWYRVGDRRETHDGEGALSNATTLAQGNDHLGISIETSIDPPGDLWWSPIETISNSESGFERVYQGSSLLVSWTVRVAPGARCTAQVDHRVRVARDRAAEDSTAAPSPR